MIENLNPSKHESNSPQGNTNSWKSKREGQIQELKFFERKQQTHTCGKLKEISQSIP